MDIIAAYREMGTYRGAAVMCGTTHKTVKRIIERQQAGGKAPSREPRAHNYDSCAELVTEKVAATHGKDLGQAAADAGQGGHRVHQARNQDRYDLIV